MTQKRRKPEGYDDMTHDELLERIKEKGRADFSTIMHNPEGQKDIQDVFKALRAVVELHNQGNTGECGDEGCCGGYTPDICGYCHDEYPCDTIQAIERAMK